MHTRLFSELKLFLFLLRVQTSGRGNFARRRLPLDSAAKPRQCSSGRGDDAWNIHPLSRLPLRPGEKPNVTRCRPLRVHAASLHSALQDCLSHGLPCFSSLQPLLTDNPTLHSFSAAHICPQLYLFCFTLCLVSIKRIRWHHIDTHQARYKSGVVRG